jgi:hypothetical protein
MLYAITLVQPLAQRQGLEVAKRTRHDAEYRIIRAEGLSQSPERYDGRFRKADNKERLEWIQGNQLATLEWKVIYRRSGFIPDGEPIFVRPVVLRMPLKPGLVIRMVRMSHPLGYYCVVVDERGEVIGVLEVYWNT